MIYRKKLSNLWDFSLQCSVPRSATAIRRCVVCFTFNSRRVLSAYTKEENIWLDVAEYFPPWSTLVILYVTIKISVVTFSGFFRCWWLVAIYILSIKPQPPSNYTVKIWVELIFLVLYSLSYLRTVISFLLWIIYQFSWIRSDRNIKGICGLLWLYRLNFRIYGIY